MISLLLVATLGAAPLSHPDASVAVYAPRLDRLGAVLPFFRAAGERASLFSPSTWRGDFDPLLWIDPSDPESLQRAGLDAQGSVTVSAVASTRLSCHTLADVKLFEQRAAEKLAGVGGGKWSEKLDGVSLVGATELSRVVAGYALRGREVCTAGGQGFPIDRLLRDAAKLLARPQVAAGWRQAQSLPGVAFFLERAGYGALSSSGRDRVTLTGRTTRLPVPPLAGAGPSIYADLAPSGLAFARARIAPAGLPAVTGTLVRQVIEVCPSCDEAALRQLAHELEAQLTGNVLLRVDHVKVRESLRTAPARYFAVRHAYLAEVKSAESAKKALGALAAWPQAHPVEGGFSLAVKGGEVRVGLWGTHLFVANDEAALKKVQDALPARPGQSPHGAELTVDPRLLGRGLGQVSLLDVVAASELASLFALGTELGPLLLHSERISGHADSRPEGGHAVSGTWVLEASGADGGR